MPFQVKILNAVREMILHSKEITDRFILYGFYAENEQTLLIADIESTKRDIGATSDLAKEKGSLRIVGWGYLKDPRIAYISFENFKTHSAFQDMTPYGIMVVVDAVSRKDIRIMHKNGLKLEKIPFTYVESFDRLYDSFLEHQRNLAEYTETEKQSRPSTKKEAVMAMLSELREKLVYVQSHGMGAEDYPDFIKAVEMVEQSLYGRASYYIKRAQKPLEEDVTRYRYKDKYESLLKTLKNDLGKLPSYELDNHDNEIYNTIELLIEQADTLFSSKKYKDAFSKLASAHSTVHAITEGTSAPEIRMEEPDLSEEMNFEPILTLEETLSGSLSPQTYSDTMRINEDADINEKIATFESIRTSEPGNEWVNGELGDCYFEKGDLKMALDAYRRQERKTPGDSTLLNNIGMIYKYDFNGKKAKEYFLKSISSNPDYAEAYYNYGFIRFEEGDLEDAIEYYQKAIDINPEFNLARDSLKVAVNKKNSYARQQFNWKNDNKE